MTGGLLPVPPSGFVLGAVPGSATKGALHNGLQAMRISFADLAVLEEVLKHGSDLKISFGKSMVRDYSRVNELVAAVGSGELFKGRGGSQKWRRK